MHDLITCFGFVYIDVYIYRCTLISSTSSITSFIASQVVSSCPVEESDDWSFFFEFSFEEINMVLKSSTPQKRKDNLHVTMDVTARLYCIDAYPEGFTCVILYVE